MADRIVASAAGGAIVGACVSFYNCQRERKELIP